MYQLISDIPVFPVETEFPGIAVEPRQPLAVTLEAFDPLPPFFVFAENLVSECRSGETDFQTLFRPAKTVLVVSDDSVDE